MPKLMVIQKDAVMEKKKKEYTVYLIKVDEEKCDGCGECLEFCPVYVFELPLPYRAYPVRPENCLGCRTCQAVCRTDAIIITEI